MRSFALAVAAALAMSLPACGPSFDGEGEELAYLKALSNPSPAQWKRREELAKKEADAAVADAAKQRADREVLRPREVYETALEARREGKPSTAGDALKLLIRSYPSSPEAALAPALIEQCLAEARAKDAAWRAEAARSK
jgi:TolA-binding protein